MNADLSVAPEIAQLAVSPAPCTAGAPHTVGRAAAGLSSLAADPRRWWDLVRFDPDGPARIKVPGAYGAWLLVLPPGATADCDCRYATLLAGEACESPARPLRPGRVRVHGSHALHTIRGASHGYSVSLHWTDRDVRSEEIQGFLSRTAGGGLFLPMPFMPHLLILPGE